MNSKLIFIFLLSLVVFNSYAQTKHYYIGETDYLNHMTPLKYSQTMMDDLNFDSGNAFGVKMNVLRETLEQLNYYSMSTVFPNSSVSGGENYQFEVDILNIENKKGESTSGIEANVQRIKDIGDNFLLGNPHAHKVFFEKHDLDFEFLTYFTAFSVKYKIYPLGKEAKVSQRLKPYGSWRDYELVELENGDVRNNDDPITSAQEPVVLQPQLLEAGWILAWHSDGSLMKINARRLNYISSPEQEIIKGPTITPQVRPQNNMIFAVATAANSGGSITKDLLIVFIKSRFPNLEENCASFKNSRCSLIRTSIQADPRLHFAGRDHELIAVIELNQADLFDPVAAIEAEEIKKEMRRSIRRSRRNHEEDE